MYKKAVKFGFAITAVSTLMAACEPLDDSSWTNNSQVVLDWRKANPESGLRPDDIDSLMINYYSQSENILEYEYPMERDKEEFEVKNNCYDILVTEPSPFYNNTDKFRSITLELPTAVNEKAERIITQNPEQMLYTGLLSGVTLNLNVRHSIEIEMRPLFKKINFVVTIIDEQELVKPVQMDMSGVASEKRLWDGVCNSETESIAIFNLVKQGRVLNTGRYTTAFKGHFLCLGMAGQNILFLTYYDAKGDKRMANYELTPNFSNWNLEEITIRISIDAEDNSVNLEGWELGDTTDHIFEYNEINGEGGSHVQ